MYSPKSIDQLQQMKKALIQVNDKEVIRAQLDNISQQGVSQLVESLCEDVFGYIDSPAFDDCHKYQVREKHLNLSKPEILKLILKNIDKALVGISEEPVYEIIKTHIELDKVKIRVRKVLEGDWGEILYQSLDEPHRYFGYYVLGSHAMYSKKIEIPISPEIVEAGDVGSLREELKKFKPIR